jgi:signal transduction histidine kinase/CheY-like chemotaxis protein
MQELRENRSGGGPILLLSVACVITALVLALSVWAAYDSFRKFSTVTEQGLRLQELRGEIVLYDEVLTMSARMAAATGDPRWEQRYWEAEPKLTRSMEQARGLVPDLVTAAQTEASNDELIALEEQVLELVRESRLAEARAILDSDEYARHKSVYAAGMTELGTGLEQAAMVTAASLRERASLQVAGSLIAFLLLSGGWVFVLRVANRWRRDIAASTEQLALLNRDLDRKVSERTAELAEATERAEAANTAKSAFLANMSHELRTPMNAILGYSEILMEEAEDTDQPQLLSDLEKINDAGRHLLSLINDVLDLSKIEAGRTELFVERFDVSALIEGVVSTIRPLIEKNGNELVVPRAEGLGEMRADVTKLRQALLNLLSNASKFTEQGTVTLTVGRDDENGVFRFDVTDTGIGIPADRRDKIFEAFTQADESTTRNYGGTGLGLAISRRFCRMMGGDIAVTTEIGRGSTFSILLPITVDQQDAATAPEGDQNLSESDAPLVLVIDDDPAARDLIGRTITSNGFRVVTADGAQDGLRKARELKPMAITLDVVMPGTDGWSALTALKAEPELRDIPVMMVSMLDDNRLAHALGASEYLSKPIDREQLSRILTRYLGAGTGDKVLIVEDDRDTREMLKRLMEREGWDAVVAENGRVGLEQVAACGPALIFTDLMMPEMDGFDFVAELRSKAEWRDIPVVVVTAKDLTEDDRLRLSGHVERILEKGTGDPSELLAKLRDLAGKRKRA